MLTLSITIDGGVGRCQEDLTLELLQLGLQLGKFTFALLDKNGHIAEGSSILSHLAELLGALFDLQLLADLSPNGLLDLLQPYGHTALRQILCETIFVTELVQNGMLDVFALWVRKNGNMKKVIHIFVIKFNSSF